MCLYAPDVTVGPDGRYYLYYVLDKVPVVSVAVCDTPAGAYEFYGYVHYPDGTRLGEREGDEPQFDPGVLTEGDRTYLYTGFCQKGDTSRSGPMGTVLGPDMLTIVEGPVTIAPSQPYSAGSSFEGHEFFEASSIRKRGDTYYFIYSSIAMHELCYAVSDNPMKGFVYGGVIVSNADMHIDSYKPADRNMAYGGNNHGSMVEIMGKWYIFYHRHTDGTNFSRQGCIEPISFREDGRHRTGRTHLLRRQRRPIDWKRRIPGLSGLQSLGKRRGAHHRRAPENGWTAVSPKVTQDGKDGDEETGYVANLRDGSHAGFKYFDCKGVSGISIRVRGYCSGAFGVKTKWDGEVLDWIPVEFSNEWKEYRADIAVPDGIQALYFVYKGTGAANLASFTLE